MRLYLFDIIFLFEIPFDSEFTSIHLSIFANEKAKQDFFWLNLMFSPEYSNVSRYVYQY